jgi:hypothetical protein
MLSMPRGQDGTGEHETSGKPLGPMVTVIVFVPTHEQPERNERHDVSSDDKCCAHSSREAS